MARTGMRAMGLRVRRRMAHGPKSTVYVLAKTAGVDSLTSLGSSEAANLSGDGGTWTLSICEDSTLTVTAMERAAAFALASPADETFRVWKRTEAVMPVGANDRTWSFTVTPTGVTFVLGNYFLLEAGVDQIAMEDSGLILQEA